MSTYTKPTNNLNIETKGLEFDLNIGRIDAIRTAFQINGSWMRTKSWRQGYSFYDNSEDAASARKPVAIYSQEGNINYQQQFVTTLRATHNIPRIGFVVTMTAQAIWQQSNWNTFGNDSIPIGYLALEDASVNMFPQGQYTTTQQVKDAGNEYKIPNVLSSRFSDDDIFYIAVPGIKSGCYWNYLYKYSHSWRLVCMGNFIVIRISVIFGRMGEFFLSGFLENCTDGK